MIRTTDSIYIDAPVEKVFEFYTNPANWESIAPSWLDAKYLDVKTTPEVKGTTFSYKAKMAGLVDMEGAGEFTDAVPNRRIVLRDTGRTGQTETMTFLFEPVGSGMTLTVLDERAEFPIERIPMVGSLAEWVVDRLGVQWMHVLKAKMEGRA